MGMAAALPPIPRALRLRWVPLLPAGLTRSREQERTADRAGTSLSVGLEKVVLVPLMTLLLPTRDTDLGSSHLTSLFHL